MTMILDRFRVPRRRNSIAHTTSNPLTRALAIESCRRARETIYTRERPITVWLATHAAVETLGTDLYLELSSRQLGQMCFFRSKIDQHEKCTGC